MVDSVCTRKQRSLLIDTFTRASNVKMSQQLFLSTSLASAKMGGNNFLVFKWKQPRAQPFAFVPNYACQMHTSVICGFDLSQGNVHPG